MATDPIPLGTRIKSYEKDAETHLNPAQPWIARLDGHAFSKFTRGFDKPFDKLLAESMYKTMEDLLIEFNATTAYTQSDEISLIFPVQLDKEGIPVHRMYNGRVQKIASLLAGFCSMRFLYNLQNVIAQHHNKSVIDNVGRGMVWFDARVFNVPSTEQVFNTIYWRMNHDCVRNAISNFSRQYFSNKELYGINTLQQKEMLMAKGINYDTAMPPEYRFGMFCKREKYTLEGQPHAIRTRPVRFTLLLDKFDQQICDLFLRNTFNVHKSEL